MTTPMQRDPVRLLLGIAILGGLVATSFWILRPFLPALIWATMVVVATWPMMRAVQRRLWNQSLLATAVMTVAMLLVFVIPLVLAIVTIVDHMDVITGWVKSLHTRTFDVPPEWVEKIPFAGTRIGDAWREQAATGELGARLSSWAAIVGAWFVAQMGDLGGLVLQFLLTVATAAILYAKGETAVASVIRFAGIGTPSG